ncbi:MAG: hypothetical protein ACI9XO_001651 [Paraglaciecola sp.]|jgi:hypothetical protein
MVVVKLQLLILSPLLSEDEFGRIGISESHFHRPIDKSVREMGAESIEVKGTFSDLKDDEKITYLTWLDATDNTIGLWMEFKSYKIVND